MAMNAFGLQNLRIVVWQKGDGAHAVIHKPDFYPFFCLSFQYFQNRIPHNTVFYNKILHKNELPGFFQLFLQTFKLLLSTWKILCRIVFINRESTKLSHIISQTT